MCQGIGEARGVSPGWLRRGVVALTLLGAVLYLAAWLISAVTRGLVVDGDPERT